MQFPIPITILALSSMFSAHTAIHAQGANPVAWWSFDEPSDQKVLDQSGNHRDQLDGRYTVVDGVRGKAIRFDSFTTEITREAAKAPALSGGFAVEGHVAFGAYPWNWCALITQRDEEAAGFSVDIGTRGELRLQLKVGDQWLSCTSPEQTIPLWEWTHVVANYGTDCRIGKRDRIEGSDLIVWLKLETGNPIQIRLVPTP